jgi:hypothetical protein
VFLVTLRSIRPAIHAPVIPMPVRKIALLRIRNWRASGWLNQAFATRE